MSDVSLLVGYVLIFSSLTRADISNAGQGDEGSPGRVSRADVAAVAIAALDQPDASNRKTIELCSEQAEDVAADQLRHVFDGTKADA